VKIDDIFPMQTPVQSSV